MNHVQTIKPRRNYRNMMINSPESVFIVADCCIKNDQTSYERPKVNLCKICSRANEFDPDRLLALLSITISLSPDLASQVSEASNLLPLHIICKRVPNFEDAIALVLKAYTSAINMPTPDGWLPLHQVCKYSSNIKVLKLVYDAYPNASLKATKRGLFPYDLINQNNTILNSREKFIEEVCSYCPLLNKDNIHDLYSESSPVIAIAIEETEDDDTRLMFEQFENPTDLFFSSKDFTRIAQTPFCDGQYALHILCRKLEPFRIIKEIHEAFPGATMIATTRGWYPLHIVCRYSDDFNTIQLILNSYPDAAKIMTTDGWLPLHQLCRYSHSLEAIKAVYLSYPDAANIKTPNGSYAIDLLSKYCPLSYQINTQFGDEKTNEVINHVTYKPFTSAVIIPNYKQSSCNEFDPKFQTSVGNTIDRYDSQQENVTVDDIYMDPESMRSQMIADIVKNDTVKIELQVNFEDVCQLLSSGLRSSV